MVLAGSRYCFIDGPLLSKSVCGQQSWDVTFENCPGRLFNNPNPWKTQKKNFRGDLFPFPMHSLYGIVNTRFAQSHTEQQDIFGDQASVHRHLERLSWSIKHRTSPSGLALPERMPSCNLRILCEVVGIDSSAFTSNKICEELVH